MSVCGLDFGTSNSTVALPSGEVLEIDLQAENRRLFRSVLFFPEEEREHFAGAEAIDRYLDEPAGRFIQSVKSWLPSRSFTHTQIRHRPVTLEDLVSMLLRRIREGAERAAGVEVRRVVMGRPAVFSTEAAADALAQNRLQRAAEQAGFQEVVFLIEPIAAALAYEARLDRDERVLVGDFGAGTSDFTVMDLGPSRRGARSRTADVVGSGGVRIGGDSFDAAIMKHALLPLFGGGTKYRERFGSQWLRLPQHIERKLLNWHEMSFIRERSIQELIATMLETSDNVPAIEALHDLVMHNLGFQLFRAIERAKVQLSSEEATRIDYDEDRVHVHVPIERAQFEEYCRPLLDELAECVNGLLERTGDRVDAVFLTGGSSYIPAVRALFSRRFGEERIRTADAFTSVVEGLGRATASLLGEVE
ncbi:MAG TPA: Hsp70 family protein [Myxococcaceae bacterium]